MFLWAWRNERTALRADLQRYYGMNIERIGADFTIWQAAACAAALPLGSALMAAVEPKAQYTLTNYLLHRISEQLAGQHIPYPWETDDKPVADFGAMDIDDFKRWHELKFSERGLNG